MAEFGSEWGYMTDVPVGERRVSIWLHVEGPREESLDVYQALANAIQSEVDSRE